MRFIEAVAGLHTGKFTRIRCQGVSYGNYGGRLAGGQASSEHPPSREDMVDALVSGIPEFQAMAMACCIDPVLMCSDEWVGTIPEPEPYEADLDDEDDASDDEDPGQHPFKVGDLVEVVDTGFCSPKFNLSKGRQLVVKHADIQGGYHFVGFDNDTHGEWYPEHFKLVSRARPKQPGVFSVGDRVRFTKDDYHCGAKVGDLATVVNVWAPDSFGVELDKPGSKGRTRFDEEEGFAVLRLQIEHA